MTRKSIVIPAESVDSSIIMFRNKKVRKRRPHPLTERVEELERICKEMIEELLRPPRSKRNEAGFLANIPKKARATRKRKRL